MGSAVNLTNRLKKYFTPIFLKKEILKYRSKINNSLLKYGYNKFSLDILEYYEPSALIKREQYYLDILKPEYNILKITGLRLGCKHSLETIINIKLAIKDRALSPLRRINHLLATGHITTVVNKKDSSIKVYDSIGAVSRDIGINHVTILNYINTNK